MSEENRSSKPSNTTNKEIADSDNHPDAPDSELGAKRNGLDRRSFLKAAGAATIATAGVASGAASSATSHGGITFDRVVNAVDDLGMDPTGSTPIDSAFEANIQTGTLIEFPPGTYLFDRHHYYDGVSRFGIRGTGSSHRDVQFTPTKDSALLLIAGFAGSGILIDNLSLQQRNDETTAAAIGLNSPDNSLIRDVEWLGVTPDDDNGLDFNLTYATTDISGVNVAERITHGVDAESVEVPYPGGAQTIRGGPGHVGELILRDAELRNANENATRYTSEGVLTVEGGVFANNQNTQLRFSAGNHPSKVSSARGVHIIVDDPETQVSACIQLDSSPAADYGAIFEDCVIESINAKGDGGGRGVIDFPTWGAHGSATFRNCVIRNERPGRTVSGARIESGRPVPEETAITFENCSFTGNGGGFYAHSDRSGSVIHKSCVDMPNADITGFKTQNVSSSSCRIPSDVLGGSSGGSTDDGSTDGSTGGSTDGSTTPTLHTFSIQTTEDAPLVQYSLTVDGDAARGMNAEKSDFLTNSDGTVQIDGYAANGSEDTYNYVGSIVAWSADVDAQYYDLFIDGEPVDPSSLNQ
ncbi:MULTISPECIES: hypothetical protein [Haloferax]|uniref:Rhodanese domain-containing protein n=1 Tax=Haloferax marinum TaxID=2666143 RepID=A0A6A8GA75_9EURY|nr:MULTISPECIES: hypothetical protein [Haloferax]KAB1198508.1 hypothetical protein Hfx1150_13685 [Haloferax sp. CBA1150]MRW97615.1 hypothetical protein [Haloferax marinum]